MVYILGFKHEYLFSGADNGTAIVLHVSADQCHQSVNNFKEALKSVCLEPPSESGSVSSSGKSAKQIQNGSVSVDDRAYVVGTSSGRLIHHRTEASWFRNNAQDLVLFGGMGSAVSSILWEGSLVAWSDASHVSFITINNK
jgi:hypothetical protein